MSFSINTIRAQLEYGGARNSQFEVRITNPINPVGDIKIPFMAKAANIPVSTVGVINVPYFGRIVKEPGDRTFEPWTVTVINDEDFLIRNAMEAWHNAINASERNIATRGSAPNNYKSQGTVTQFGKDGSELRIYQFNGLWPSAISTIDLNWETQNSIEQFDITFEYDNFVVVGGSTGFGGDT